MPYNSNDLHKGSKIFFKDMFSASTYYETDASGLEVLKKTAF